MKQTIQTQVGPVEILLPNFDAIPERLRALPMALWTAEPEIDAAGNQKLKANGRPRIKKAPRNAAGFNISKNQPAAWLGFDTARKSFNPSRFSGIGVLMQAASGLVGIDLDDVSELLKASEPLRKIISRARDEKIYCESSPSGSGLRLFVIGTLPNNSGRKLGGIELYSDIAFLTVTGLSVWPGAILEAQWLVNQLLEVIGLNSGSENNNIASLKTVDSQVDSTQIDLLAEWARYHHPQLWNGHWNERRNLLLDKEYPSQSEADMALVGQLAREANKRGVSGNALSSMVFLTFQRSGLFRPEKTQQIVKHAIPKAIKSLAEYPVGPVSTPPEIDEVNKRFALIEGLGIYDKTQAAFTSTEQFRLLYQNRLVNIGTGQSPRLITLDKIWLASHCRGQYSALEMAPGEPERTRSGALNTYRGFSVTPQAGDIQPFLNLLTWLIPNPSDQDYFLNFIAYKVKNPTARYATAAVLWSVTQGVGKNLLIETWASLFDEKHWSIVGQEVFSDQFTEWQHLKLVVIADEVSSTSSRAVADRIKGWVTASKNRINEKGAKKFQETNLTTYVFLSNHPDAVFLDDTDRRFWVVECTKQRPSTGLIQRFVAWRDACGKANLLDYLLNRDTGGYNPREPAPMTLSKLEMIEDNKSDLERWVGKILSAANLESLIGREVVSVEELAERYRNDTKRDVSTKAVNGALRKAQVTRLIRQARRKDGTRPRVYALRNQARYQEMTDTQLGNLMDSSPFKHF